MGKTIKENKWNLYKIILILGILGSTFNWMYTYSTAEEYRFSALEMSMELIKQSQADLKDTIQQQNKFYSELVKAVASIPTRISVIESNAELEVKLEAKMESN